MENIVLDEKQKNEYKQHAIELYEKHRQPIEIVEKVEKMVEDGKTKTEITSFLEKFVIDRLCEIAYPNPNDTDKRKKLEDNLNKKAEKVGIRSMDERSEKLIELSKKNNAAAFFYDKENCIYVPNLDNVYMFTGNFIHEFLHSMSHANKDYAFYFFKDGILYPNKAVDEIATVNLVKKIANTSQQGFGSSYSVQEKYCLNAILAATGVSDADFVQMYLQTNPNKTWLNDDMRNTFNKQNPEMLEKTMENFCRFREFGKVDVEKVYESIEENKEYANVDKTELNKKLTALRLLDDQYKSFPSEVLEDEILFDAYLAYLKKLEEDKKLETNKDPLSGFAEM